MKPVEIDRWHPEQIDEVFAICRGRQQTCTDLSDSLHSPEVFQTWGGLAAESAVDAANRHRVDIDAHGQEVARVGAVIARATDEAREVKTSLQAARDFVARHQLSLDDNSGKVTLNTIQQWLINEITVRSPERAASDAALLRSLREAQAMVDSVMTRADTADRDTALAIQASTGIVSPDDLRVIPDHVAPRGELPGRPLRSASDTISDQYPTGTTRLLDVDVPKGWTDPTMTSDLAAKYGRKVDFDPDSPGVTAGYSGDILKHNKRGNLGGTNPDIVIPARPAPEQPKPYDAVRPGGAALTGGFERGAQLRVTGATPTGMHQVEVNGHNYLAVDYQYQYEAKQVDVVKVQDIPFATKNHDDWVPIDGREAQSLAQRGVPFPNPERP